VRMGAVARGRCVAARAAKGRKLLLK